MKKNLLGKSYGDILNMFEYGKLTTEETIKKLSVMRSGKVAQIQQTEPPEECLDEILAELESLIGLDNVKGLVKEIQAYIQIQKKRRVEQLAADALVLHMIFRGNPGTGKTTVARLLGKIFQKMGVLEKGHLIEVERADLVGEYIGHTAVKVRDQIKRSIGGIMFIDEAYSLARGGEKDFGKEAIDALVKGMEDYKDNLVLILAGYKDEMDIFLRSNPGLKSRFPIHIDFPDYNLEELLLIAERMVEKRDYKLSLSSKAKLAKIISKKRIEDGINSGNARLVRNIIERAIRKQAVRLQNGGNFSRENLLLLSNDDITEEDFL
ncbi:stage V sporulation protein K [Geosporobacter subterraneus DSM 17957]|uniref:Stage V sporulation protein K n=1 Tax=Geosporobacter subterraneus DSM 17957 TaxID=1121919 RepID=A0A1M6K732_9FIRM|nr:AAA family ATPase [Geosporobacter subterraneus]SHJ54806.1 stage V sporulation protein K [Geosporobacter subterraneus DSM 17957]